MVRSGVPERVADPHLADAREKSPNTKANARQLLGTSVLPRIGELKVDRTTTRRLEELFEPMVETHATSTIDRNWNYLNQALEHGVRNRTIKTNPAAGMLPPAKRPSKEFKSFTVDQALALLTEAIPADSRPAMWLTGLMCGLRPGELAGLRWPYVDIVADEPVLEVFERAHEVDDKYVGQMMPKTPRSKRRLALHPLDVAALYDDEGFVFCTRNGTPISLTNLRRSFRKLCEEAGMGDDWTTYELRHSFVSLVSDQLDDLVKVADLAGHVDTRTTEGYRTPSGRACPTQWRRGTGSSNVRRPSRKQCVSSSPISR